MDNPPNSDKFGVLTTPLSRRGWPTWLVYLVAALGLVYILNPTLGVLEFLPDNLPIVGNLDDMEVVDKLDTEEVKATARARIEEAGTRGFVLSGTASGTSMRVKKKPVYLKNAKTSRLPETANIMMRRRAR